MILGHLPLHYAASYLRGCCSQFHCAWREWRLRALASRINHRGFHISTPINEKLTSAFFTLSGTLLGSIISCAEKNTPLKSSFDMINIPFCGNKSGARCKGRRHPEYRATSATVNNVGYLRLSSRSHCIWGKYLLSLSLSLSYRVSSRPDLINPYASPLFLFNLRFFPDLKLVSLALIGYVF